MNKVCPKKCFLDNDVGFNMLRCGPFLFWMSVLSILTLNVLGEDKGEEGDSRPRPLVVMKQATIQGRVFFISESGKGSSAGHLVVRIHTSDGKKSLQETKTDKRGQYTLSFLEVGEYQLTVGRLILRLVVEEGKKGSDERKLPKVIMVFIPQELG